MKAVAFTEFGGPEVLKVLDLPEPHAGPGEVRVRVKAAGVQPYDAAVRAGWEPPGLELGWPRVPGNEFAASSTKAISRPAPKFSASPPSKPPPSTSSCPPPMSRRSRPKCRGKSPVG